MNPFLKTTSRSAKGSTTVRAGRGLEDPPKKSLKPSDISRGTKAKVRDLVTDDDRAELKRRAEKTTKKKEKPKSKKSARFEVDDFDPDEEFRDHIEEFEAREQEVEAERKAKKERKAKREERKTKAKVKKEKALKSRKEREPSMERDDGSSVSDLEVYEITPGLDEDYEDQEERVEKIKTPKSKVRDLQLVESPKPSKISKLTKVKGKKLRSIIATDAESILQLIETDSYDTASTLIYKRILQSLVDVVGYSEAMIRRTKGQRGTHQLNILISSIRDIMIDMQQAQDRGRLGESLVEKIVMPAFLDIGMMLLRENEMLLQKLKRDLPESQFKSYEQMITNSERVAGTFIQDQFKTVREEVRKYLQQ